MAVIAEYFYFLVSCMRFGVFSSTVYSEPEFQSVSKASMTIGGGMRCPSAFSHLSINSLNLRNKSDGISSNHL